MRLPLLCLLLAWVAPALAAVNEVPVAGAPAAVGRIDDRTITWFEAGRPTVQARFALHALESAHTHGLDPADYGAAGLRRAIDELTAAPVIGAARLSEIERRLTSAMLRLLNDLRVGRIDPRRIHVRYSLPPAVRFDVAALREAVETNRLADLIDQAPPQIAQYRLLRDALARYRTLSDSPSGRKAWQRPLPVPPGGQLVPGQPYAGLPELIDRLRLLGELSATAATAATVATGTTSTTAGPVYGPVLADAVRRFQRRHGVLDDGVLGRGTRALLDVPPWLRLRQIELTLERLRWTPLMQAPRRITVNIPEFVLRVYDLRDGRPVVRWSMKVIVGRSLDTRTPLIEEPMRSIEFSPYWNVPISIIRTELAPHWSSRPAEFERDGFEFMTPGAEPDRHFSTARLESVLAGQARVRQRPGPRNVLGDIKFVFPNNENIYLHHTLSTALFARDRRDLSHGCIRVEDPVGLAQFVLEGQAGWDPDRIRQAMSAGRSQTLRLEQPLPVLLTYATAVSKDGRTHFYEDIYGHDRTLDVALRQRTAQAQPAKAQPAKAQPGMAQPGMAGPPANRLSMALPAGSATGVAAAVSRY